MRKYFLVIMIFVYISICCNTGLAQTQTTIPVTFGAQFFGNYSYSVQGIDGQDFNKFDIDRLYFTAKSQLSENWKLQMTTDIFRNSATGSYYSGLAIRLKFGFVDYTPIPELSIKAGMIPGPWNSLVEAFWKYRGVAQTANDKYSYVQTADLGASVAYTLPDNYGEIAGYVLNGDGYTAPESNQFKDVILRASLMPFPGSSVFKTLTLGGYTYLGKSTGITGLKKQRYGGLLGWSYDIVTMGTEYDSRTDGTIDAPDVNGDVLSLFTELKIPVASLQSKLSVIFRYDIADPNKDKDNDKTYYFIAGLVWKATDKVSIVLDRQIMTGDSATMKTSAGGVTDRDEKWFIHTIITF